MKKNIFSIIITAAVIIMFSGCAIKQPPTASPSGGFSTVAPTAPHTSPSATPTLTPAPTLMPGISASPEPSGWTFSWFVMPSYFVEFLGGDLYNDYVDVINALCAGDSTVQLNYASDNRSWEKVRRAIQIAFVPRDLLYDSRYHIEGPFSFDAKTRTLTIRYGFEGSSPLLKDKAAYLEAVSAFEKQITEIIDNAVSNPADKLQAAMDLFDFVSGFLTYKLDMRLSLYDAFTKQLAFCQTYSQMYQYLLWQMDIPCYLYGGEIDHEWNVIELEGEHYQVDTTWQSTGNAAPYYYFGMSDGMSSITGHGRKDRFIIADALFGNKKPFVCSNRQYENMGTGLNSHTGE